MKITKAVIPVAGFGTRFLPITKTVQKELLPIIDKPVLQYVVDEAVQAGLKEFIFVISPEKSAIKDYFEPYPELEARLKKTKKFAEVDELKKISKGLKFSYVIQKVPLGTGHALLCAEKLVGKDNFAYFDGDAIFASKTPVIGRVMKLFEKYNADGAIGGMRIERQYVVRYGNLLVEKLDNDYKLKGIIEKPTLEDAPKENLVVSGQRYVLSNKIFKYLKTQKPGVKNEIWLADAADRLSKEGNFYACEIEGKWYDTGNKLEYLKTVVEFALKRADIGQDFKKYLESLLD